MVRINKALFLDRDGVINRERGEYTFKVSDFDILPSVSETIKEARKRGYLIIVITNQGGIAKGLYTHSDVHKVHEYLNEELNKNHAFIDDIYYSPHHQDYSKSLDRKPGSLMLEKALAVHNIDPELSFMIGDSQRDIIAAEAVQVKGFLISPNTSIEFILNHLK